MKCKRWAVGTLVIVFVVCGASRRSYAQEGNWDERFGLPNLGSVFTLGLTDDGKLYTGGSFPGNAFGAGGGLNAFLISRLKLPPLIVTLGSFSMFRGIAEGMTHAAVNYTDFPKSFPGPAIRPLPGDA